MLSHRKKESYSRETSGSSHGSRWLQDENTKPSLSPWRPGRDGASRGWSRHGKRRISVSKQKEPSTKHTGNREDWRGNMIKKRQFLNSSWQTSRATNKNTWKA